jgi:vacuolar protein sorting-associated protein 35
LLVAAGAVYIETKEVKSTAILGDLLQMAKGVQHPIRGLFLRYYLLKTCKNKFPDTGNAFEKFNLLILMINPKKGRTAR